MFFVSQATGWQAGRFSVLSPGLAGKPYAVATFDTEDEASDHADTLNSIHPEKEVEYEELPDDMQQFLAMV